MLHSFRFFMSFRLAVVQFFITHLDRERNFLRIEEFIQQAVKQQAQVIVFPEDCVTGSIFGDLSRLDVNESNKVRFQKLANKYCIDIVSGSSMEGTPQGNFNMGYYIDAEGQVLGVYKKNHLYPSEHKFLSPGTEALVFETAYGKAGIVICWDMLFPEIFQRLKAQGVQIIYCPSYWYREIAESISTRDVFSEERLLDALSLTRAVETNAVLVYCNAAGIMKNPNGSTDTLIGHSQVVLPALGPLAKVEDNEECMFVVDVNLEHLSQTAQVYRA